MNQPSSCVLIGSARSGTVAPSMLVSVPLNNSLSLSLRIKAVGYWERTDELALSLECSGPDEAKLVAGLDISDEELLCYEQEERGGVERCVAADERRGGIRRRSQLNAVFGGHGIGVVAGQSPLGEETHE